MRPRSYSHQNESLNATIWKRCPKEKFFGVEAVRTAVASAITSWNIGANSLLGILNALDLEIFPYTNRRVMVKDNVRRFHAKRSICSKEKRKLGKMSKNRSEEVARQRFGQDYVPGQE